MSLPPALRRQKRRDDLMTIPELQTFRADDNDKHGGRDILMHSRIPIPVLETGSVVLRIVKADS